MSINSVTPVELHNLSAESGGGLTVIDLREAGENESLHASIGANHPLSALSRGELGSLMRLPLSEPIYFFCRSGQRSRKGGEILRSRSFTQLINDTGGILVWQAAGLPVVGKDVT